MTPVEVFTLADERFLPGLAGLINSLRHTGFDGTVIIGVPRLIPALENVPRVRMVELRDEETWIGCLKPALMLREATGSFAFIDADIIVEGRDVMSAIGAMADASPTLALEGLVAPTDHRRRRWTKRLNASHARPDAWAYYNSGFLAGRIDRDRALLENWDQAIRRVIPRSSGHFDDQDFPLVDQDVLNGVMQSLTLEVTTLQFPDWWSAVAPLNPFLHVGGFKQTALFHCTGAKPWDLDAAPPRAPTPYEERWYQHVLQSPSVIDVDCRLPADVRGWLAGSWSGRLASRSRGLRRRLRGR